MLSTDFKTGVENGDAGLKNQVLSAHFMCKEYGGRPADDVLGDPFKFAVNNLVGCIGTQYENEEAEKRKKKNKAAK